MLVISVEFLHRTFRGDPSGVANTGRLSRGEWPPSPLRLFAALVSADGTRDNCWATENSSALSWFEKLSPPRIYAEPNPSHQSLLDRYVVKYRHTGVNKKKLKRQQEYINRESALIRPGVRVSLKESDVIYLWDVEIPNKAILTALQQRAARVGYLGTSDSPVRVVVSTELPSIHEKSAVFVPDNSGDFVIHSAKSGDLKIMDQWYDDWMSRGASVSRSQYLSLGHESRYLHPESHIPDDQGEVVAWMKLESSVSGRRISSLTQLFKKALLCQYQRLYGEPPQVLHGHGFREKGYEIARYLALPDVGYRWSRGRIHGLALWIPPKSCPMEKERSRNAAFAVRQLKDKPSIDVSVFPNTGHLNHNSRPIAASSYRWLKHSSVWVTAFPVIHERRKRLINLDEVTRWCTHAGLPEPIDIQSSRTPLAQGAIDLAPIEVNRPNRPALPYSHLRIRFAHPISGPVVLGSGRQRGFGLCIPQD